MLKAEVQFPNLVFNIKRIDFGCILNDIEVVEHATMTNNSSLQVRFSWFFVDRPPVLMGTPHTDHLDNGVESDSEYNSSNEVSCSGENEEKQQEEEEEEGSGAGDVEGLISMTCSNGSQRVSTHDVALKHPLVDSVGVLTGEGTVDGTRQDSSVVASNADLTEDPQLGLRDLETVKKNCEKKSKYLMKKKRRKNTIEPWMIAKDPLTPIPISQVINCN